MPNILKKISEIAKNEGVTITALELKIGASKGVLSRALKHDTDIQCKWLVKLVENFPQYSPDWLITGSGPMLKAEANAVLHEIRDQHRSTGLPVPQYMMPATSQVADLLNGNRKGIEPIDYIQIATLPRCDGALPVPGDGLHPIIRSGDLACYKEVNDPSKIVWGEMYFTAIHHDGDDFLFAKYLSKSDKPGFIKLSNHNRHHQDKEFPFASITGLAIIKATIRINTGF